MSPSRKTEIKRFMRAVERPTVDLSILLHDVEDPVNVGSAFRISDAGRISELILTGITPRPPHPLISKVGRAKDKRVPWRHEADVEQAIASVKARGGFVCAVEITDRAVPYYEVDWPAKTCLVVGHEDHGVTRRVLERVDATVFIPMYGKGASLNVHVALGIVAFHVLHSDRMRAGAHRALAEPERVG